MSDINYDVRSRAGHLRKECSRAVNEALTRLGVVRPAGRAKEIMDASERCLTDIAKDNEQLRQPRHKITDLPAVVEDETDYKQLYEATFAALTQLMICYHADEWDVEIPDAYRANAVKVSNAIVGEG